VGLPVEMGPAQLREQLAAAHHLAHVAGELFEQVPLGGRDPHVLAVARDAVVRDVDGEGRRLDHGSGLGDGVPDRHPQAGEQLVHGERFGQVVVGAGIQRGDLVVGRLPGGQHHHRHARPAAQRVQHVHAVEVGQPQVQHDELDVAAAGGVQRGGAGVGDDDVVPVGAQGDRQRAGERWVVLDHKNAGHPASRGSVTTIVRPPPGVSSASSVPPFASTKPRATASPRPRP